MTIQEYTETKENKRLEDIRMFSIKTDLLTVVDLLKEAFFV